MHESFKEGYIDITRPSLLKSYDKPLLSYTSIQSVHPKPVNQYVEGFRYLYRQLCKQHKKDDSRRLGDLYKKARVQWMNFSKTQKYRYQKRAELMFMQRNDKIAEMMPGQMTQAEMVQADE